MVKTTLGKLELLEYIEKHKAMTVYQLAQETGGNYNDIFDHVRDLSDAGDLKIRHETRNGRQLSIVEHPCHQRLRHLDEMYTLKRLLQCSILHEGCDSK